jgi:hypothetical protein
LGAILLFQLAGNLFVISCDRVKGFVRDAIFKGVKGKDTDEAVTAFDAVVKEG